MAMKITVKASDVWWYCQSHRDELTRDMHLIAENPEYGAEVYITDDMGFPMVMVIVDGNDVYEETAINQTDMTRIVRRIYDEYLTENIFTILGDFEDDELSIFEDEEGNVYSEMEVIDRIEDRENELTAAVYDFVATVTEEKLDDDLVLEFEDIVEDLKDHFLEYMARKHKIDIRRPMYLVYEDGSEELEEFPYDNMEFEDENNPIYQS